MTSSSGVHVVVGGAGDDTLFAASRPDGIILDGGRGNDTVTGTGQRDRLTGGLGRDLLIGRDSSNTLIADEGDSGKPACLLPYTIVRVLGAHD